MLNDSPVHKQDHTDRNTDMWQSYSQITTAVCGGKNNLNLVWWPLILPPICTATSQIYFQLPCDRACHSNTLPPCPIINAQNLEVSGMYFMTYRLKKDTWCLITSNSSQSLQIMKSDTGPTGSQSSDCRWTFWSYKTFRPNGHCLQNYHCSKLSASVAPW